MCIHKWLQCIPPTEWLGMNSAVHYAGCSVPSRLFYLPRCPGWIKNCTTDESNNSLGIDTYRCPVNHLIVPLYYAVCRVLRSRGWDSLSSPPWLIITQQPPPRLISPLVKRGIGSRMFALKYVSDWYVSGGKVNSPEIAFLSNTLTTWLDREGFGHLCRIRKVTMQIDWFLASLPLSFLIATVISRVLINCTSAGFPTILWGHCSFPPALGLTRFIKATENSLPITYHHNCQRCVGRKKARTI